MNNNTNLAIAFLIAGTLLTTTTVTMATAAYAEDNKQININIGDTSNNQECFVEGRAVCITSLDCEWENVDDSLCGTEWTEPDG